MKIVKNISEEGKIFKNKIEGVKTNLAVVYAKLKRYYDVCDHELPELTPKQLKDELMSEEAHCLICGSGFGWRCKESPDGVCHYYSNDGKVKMIDGTLVNVPEGHDATYENDDECIFCGLPEERK